MSKQQLTIKQRKFIKEYIATGNATKSALAVYDTNNYNTAKSIGYENLTKLHLKKEVESLMGEAGINNVMLLDCLKAGLDSKLIAQYNSMVVETDIPDHNNRHKFLEIAIKLRGTSLT